MYEICLKKDSSTDNNNGRSDVTSKQQGKCKLATIGWKGGDVWLITTDDACALSAQQHRRPPLELPTSSSLSATTKHVSTRKEFYQVCSFGRIKLHFIQNLFDSNKNHL